MSDAPWWFLQRTPSPLLVARLRRPTDISIPACVLHGNLVFMFNVPLCVAHKRIATAVSRRELVPSKRPLPSMPPCNLLTSFTLHCGACREMYIAFKTKEEGTILFGGFADMEMAGF